MDCLYQSAYIGSGHPYYICYNCEWYNTHIFYVRFDWAFESGVCVMAHLRTTF